MYGDFKRARQKLRRKHCYCDKKSRKECLKKQNRWHLHTQRGYRKGQAPENHVKLTRRSSEEHRINPIWRLFHNALTCARGGSPHRAICPYITSFKRSISGNHRPKSKDYDLVYPSWLEDTVGALMEANSLITFIRKTCQRNKEQLQPGGAQLDEDCTLIEDETAVLDHDVVNYECKDPTKPRHLFHSKPSDTTPHEELHGEYSETPSELTATSELKILSSEYYDTQYGDRELVCNHQTSIICESSRISRDEKEKLKDTFDKDEAGAYFQNTGSVLDRNDTISCHVMNSSMLNAHAIDIEPCPEIPCSVKNARTKCFKSQTHSEDIGIQNTFNWNGLCKRQPGFVRSNLCGVLDKDVDFTGDDGYSNRNRIIYKTQPTGNFSATTQVFVCSKALNKKDSLEFGEALSMQGTDFNLNAIFNKSGHVWRSAIPGDHLPEEDEQRLLETEMKPPVPTGLGDQANHRQGTAESFGKLHADVLPDYYKSCARVRQLFWSQVNDNEHKYVTRAVLGLITAGTIALITTGNVLSFMGLMLDVVVHTALLSIVVLVALVVFEANDTTGGLLQDCPSILQLVRGLVSSDGKIKSAVVSSDGKIQSAAMLSPPMPVSNEDSQKRISKGPVPVLDGMKESCQIKADYSPLPLPETQTRVMAKESHHEINVRESSTMTEPSLLPLKPERRTAQLSFAETMTDPVKIDCISTQTDAICDEEGTVVNYLCLDNGTGTDERPCATRSVGSQANIDAKKIHEQAQKLQQKHRQNLRRLHRKFLAIRRSFQKDASNLKHCDQRKGDFLAQLQLTIPALHREKTRLIAEKFMVERQYTDQKKKNQDLIGRIAKLNQQFTILGQAQQSVSPLHQWCPQLLNQMCGSNQFRGLHAETNQQQQKGNAVGGLSLSNFQPNTTQIVLPQPQIPPLVPNKWLNNIQQFRQQQRQQLQSQSLQQNKPHQQQGRLPIFQLLHNSMMSSSTNKEEVVKQWQQQQLQFQQKPQQYQQLQHDGGGSNNPQIKMRPGLPSATHFQQGDHPAVSQNQMESVSTAGRIGQNNEKNGK